jgi:FtsP/CotA-like multicopper oxidase with cupredoxin domain
MVLTAAPDEVSVLPGAPTRVWRFTGRLLKGPADTLQTLPGSYLGPVIRLRRRQHVRVRFANNLGEDSIVHWHGLDVPESADGHPRLAIGHGQEYVYEFEVTNRAGTYWYHPHMRTGAQVYQGLAGLLLVQDDEEDTLALPSGGNEHAACADAHKDVADGTVQTRAGVVVCLSDRWAAIPRVHAD